MQKIADIFARNRAEETEEDNWAEFVVPRFLPDIGIQTQSKALVIVGGRGCGKTTLLRYFCHASQFSKRRQTLAAESLNHIGIYWRADTNFLNTFTGGGQPPETWRSAFNHLLACELGLEILSSLKSLNSTPERQAQYGRLDDLDFSDLSIFLNSRDLSFKGLEKELRNQKSTLSLWLNNLDGDENVRPVLLPGKDFLLKVISIIQSQLQYLAKASFAVFIDEYENMRDEQQKFINGMLKHSTRPLFFNIAMKRNGWRTKDTIGTEKLQEISDYREIDLEDRLFADFELFAAELLLFRLMDSVPRISDMLPAQIKNLHSVESIKGRYEDANYKGSVLSITRQLLPRITDSEAAREIIEDDLLKRKLLEKIRKAIARRGLTIPADHFVRNNFPEASIVVSSLLYRSREIPQKLYEELEKLEKGERSRLDKGGNLIENNLFGSVSAIYLSTQKPSPLFSGFEVIVLMARGNIRNFLELIHRIFLDASFSAEEVPQVDPHIQSKAIQRASEAILEQTKGHGEKGPRLHALAACLGAIFRERHRSAAQSEPEINHFTLAAYDREDSLDAYLAEAVKWSVLYTSNETKKKQIGSDSYDYILNPIYAGCFQISYRKKRSMEITGKDLMSMLEGEIRIRDDLVRTLGKTKPESEEDLFDETDHEQL